MTTEHPLFSDADIVYSYTRAQAIEDGYLVDVSATAREAGIRMPVALTRAVWERYVEPGDVPGQDVQGRLWDVLTMFRHAARAADGDRLTFRLYVVMRDAADWLASESIPERNSTFDCTTHRLVTLQAICGPGDDPTPVITILMPGED